MPSGRRRSRPDRPVFFVDRGPGRRWVPGVFRVQDVSALGWVALTRDTAIVRHHVAALRRSSLRTFALSNANLSGEQMAACFEHNLDRIVRRSRRPGPFVDVVHRERIERRWPRPGGKVW